MIRIFASDLATAIANLVVLIGIGWATFKFSKPYFIAIFQRLSSRSRQRRQKAIVDELIKLRRIRKNSFLAIHMILDRTSSKLSSLTLSLAITLIIFTFLALMAGRPEEFSAEVLAWPPIAIFREFTIAELSLLFVSAALINITISIRELKKEFRIFRNLATFDYYRRHLLKEYLKLRSLR